MSHVIDNRKKLLARVNRLMGQMGALKRHIEEAETDEHCSRIMQEIASIRGAMNGLSLLYLEEHVRAHVARGRTADDRDRAADELLSALRSLRA